MMNAHCSIQLHWVLGKHEHAARLLVPTTVLSPFPPLSGWRKCVAYATSISVIHPSLYGWRLFISTLSGWRWFISTLSGWRWFISTISGWRWFISTLQGWRMFISTLLGWRICLAYATPGSSQGYTGISVYMAMASPHVSNTPMNRCPSGLHASFLSVPQHTPITVSCQSEGLNSFKFKVAPYPMIVLLDALRFFWACKLKRVTSQMQVGGAPGVTCTSTSVFMIRNIRTYACYSTKLVCTKAVYSWLESCLSEKVAKGAVTW